MSVKDITTLILGGHSDTMVALVRFSFVGGIPLTSLNSPERLEELVARTRNGSTYDAPAAAMV